MKKPIYILLTILFPLIGFTQVVVDSINYISPFHEGFASVQKDGQWGVINEQGMLVIEYRSDMVPIKMEDGTYPIFKNGRALIQQEKDDVTYFGYIDMKGRVIIQPQFINAKNFKFNKAVVTQLIKNELGFNTVLGKPVVSYEYQEIVIDEAGAMKAFLTEPKPIVFLEPLSKIPHIQSEIVTKDLVLTHLENGQIVMTKISNKEQLF